MTKDEIIDLAKEAGAESQDHGAHWEFDDFNVFTFANAIQAKERERCAKVIENGHFLHDQSPEKLLAEQAAKAIRSLE